MFCVGCADQVIEVSFPTAESQSWTRDLHVWALEPFMRDEFDPDQIKLVDCDNVGPFPRNGPLNPSNWKERLAGRILLDGERYPFTGDIEIEIPFPPEGNLNPQGAVLLYIEAHAAIAEFGTTSAILSGCSCLLTKDSDGSDQEIAKRCVSLAEEEKIDVSLRPLLKKEEFSIVSCSSEAISAPRGQTLHPPPALCLQTIACIDRTDPSQPCYPCDFCSELDDLSFAPFVFSVGADSRIALTDEQGRAEGHLSTPADCDELAIDAKVVGQADGEVSHFSGTCVAPLGNFSCASYASLPSDERVVGVASVPHANGDRLAVLSDTNTKAVLRIFAAGTEPVLEHEISARRAEALHTFERSGQGAIAIAVSEQRTLSFSVLELRDDQLFSVAGPIRASCRPSFCGIACLSGNCCDFAADHAARVTIDSADINRDGAIDLAIGTTVPGDDGEPAPVTYFFGTGTASVAFEQDNCECGRYSAGFQTFVLAQFGGAAEPPHRPAFDIVFGTVGGTAVLYEGEGAAGMGCLGAPFGMVGEQVASLTTGSFSAGSYEDIAVGVMGSYLGNTVEYVGIYYGANRTLTINNGPLRLYPSSEPKDLLAVATGDFNGDRAQDVAALFAQKQQVHFWLGANNRGLGESTTLSLSSCGDCEDPTFLAVADQDQDRISEVVTLCGRALRRYWATP